jgi:hypothetical protein
MYVQFSPIFFFLSDFLYIYIHICFGHANIYVLQTHSCS